MSTVVLTKDERRALKQFAAAHKLTLEQAVKLLIRKAQELKQGSPPAEVLA